MNGKITFAAAAFVLLAAGCAPKPAARSIRIHVPEPTSVAKKPGCQGTCQVKAPEVLSDERADGLLAEIGAMPVGSDSLALDTLLFHDVETKARLAARPDALSSEWSAFLRKELARRDVEVTLRVVETATGRERALFSGNWPVGEKTHYLVENGIEVPPFEASGTVVRVGREHLWIRM